jgi:ribosomal protein S18 acetylase RimI-like enzyme
MLTTTIRRATERDAGELARLLTLLGHPTTESAIRASWDDWAATGNSALVASQDDDALAGAVTLHQMRVLHRPRAVGRITALIVDTPLRGRGIGRALVSAAEGALGQAGCGLLEITSNFRLTDAPAFYERLGYERTSIRLAKSIAPAG